MPPTVSSNPSTSPAQRHVAMFNASIFVIDLTGWPPDQDIEHKGVTSYKNAAKCRLISLCFGGKVHSQGQERRHYFRNGMGRDEDEMRMRQGRDEDGTRWGRDEDETRTGRDEDETITRQGQDEDKMRMMTRMITRSRSETRRGWGWGRDQVAFPHYLGHPNQPLMYQTHVYLSINMCCVF